MEGGRESSEFILDSLLTNLSSNIFLTGRLLGDHDEGSAEGPEADGHSS